MVFVCVCARVETEKWKCEGFEFLVKKKHENGFWLKMANAFACYINIVLVSSEQMKKKKEKRKLYDIHIL